MLANVETVAVLYGAAYAATAVLTGGIGYRVVTRTEMGSRRWFGALMGVLSVWALVSTPQLFVGEGPVEQGLQMGGDILALTSVLVWVVFAVGYVGRNPREERLVGLFAVAYVALLSTLLSSPLGHDLYYAAVEFSSDPFPHREAMSTSGPVRLLAFGYAFAGLGSGTYYLMRLSLDDRDRPRRMAVLLSVAVVAGAAPIVASPLGLTPVPSYDHTAFGVSGFSVVIAYAVFRDTPSDLSPVARDVVVDEVGDPILIVDSERRLVDYNDAATSLGPEFDGDSVGTGLSAVLPSLTDAVAVTEPGQYEEVQIMVGDEPRYYSVRVSGVGGESTQPAGYAILLRDITGRKAREQQLEATTRELERSNERLEDFVSVVSHDLRNPLNVATLHLQLAREEGGDEHLEQVAQAHERMETLIQNLLTLAREGTAVTERREVALSTLVARCAECVDTGDATVDVEADGTVEADPEQLQRLLENLVRNAIEHGPDDVTVSIGASTDGFYVADDGPGIPAGEREHVFERGHSPGGGTGLGLPIVREIAEGHGWSVTVTESDEGGARFEFGGVEFAD